MPAVKFTIKSPLVLSADNLNDVKWWVDSSYVEHDDTHGNTRATMSMGHGYILSMYKKNKQNTKISTEVDPIGAEDVLPHMMWKNIPLRCRDMLLARI